MRSSDPAEPRFLEPHDLAISKLGAARPKDVAFVDALIRHGMLDVPTLRERCALLPNGSDVVRERVVRFLAGYPT